MTSWGRVTSWSVRALLSLLLALGVAVGVALPSQAAGEWWLPSTWLTAAVGTVADGESILSGGPSGVAVPGAVDPLTLTWPTVTGANLEYGYRLFTPYVDLLGVASGGSAGPTLRVHRGPCIPGTGGSNAQVWCTYGPAEASLLGGVWSATCVNGLIRNNVNVPTGACANDGGLASARLGGSVTSGSVTPSLTTFSYQAGQATTTTTLTCRNLTTGVDTTVTESASGVSVAPSPVCPAGTVAIRVRVSNSISGLVSDVSVTAAALSGFGAYLGDPSQWALIPTPGGDGPCALTPKDPTMGLLSYPMNQAMCDEGGAVADPVPAPVDCGADVACVAIQGVISAVNAVKGAVDAVKGAVNRVVQAVKDGIGTVVSTIQTTVDRIIEAINAVKQAVLDGALGIAEKLQQLIDGQGGPGPGTGTGPTGSGACPGQTVADPANPVEWVKDGVECALTPDETKVAQAWDRIGNGLGEPLSGWQDGLTGIAGAWSMSPGSCQGPALVLPLGPPVGSFTLHPLDACSSLMSTVAGISYLLSTVMLLSAAAWAAAGAIAAGFGYSGGGS